MMYVLIRKDGGVTTTTLYPNALTLADGTILEVAGFSGEYLAALDPETGEVLPVKFAGNIADLTEESLLPVARLGFPAIESEIAKMPFPDEVVESHKVERSDIPTDQTFRNAWSFDGGVVVDMTKAREIHKDNLRAARAPLLAALDIQYQRADENGDSAAKAEVIAKKNALRDVTKAPGIAAATTPDQLKAVWPAAMGGPSPSA